MLYAQRRFLFLSSLNPKLFIDAERVERKKFEKQDREISSGQLLNLLVNDVNFQWLRKFLILIVEINEMFDLKDEYLQNMVEKHYSQIQNLITPDLADEMFEGKYKAFMQDNIENSTKHNELKN